MQGWLQGSNVQTEQERPFSLVVRQQQCCRLFCNLGIAHLALFVAHQIIPSDCTGLHIHPCEAQQTIPACVRACHFMRVHKCMPTCMHSYLHAHLHACAHASMRVCVPHNSCWRCNRMRLFHVYACMHTCIYLPTNMYKQAHCCHGAYTSTHSAFRLNNSRPGARDGLQAATHAWHVTLSPDETCRHPVSQCGCWAGHSHPVAITCARPSRGLSTRQSVCSVAHFTLTVLPHEYHDLINSGGWYAF
eukprot:362907-Chlamydomonas_euryale.AAC.2